MTRGADALAGFGCQGQGVRRLAMASRMVSDSRMWRASAHVALFTAWPVYPAPKITAAAKTSAPPPTTCAMDIAQLVPK